LRPGGNDPALVGAELSVGNSPEMPAQRLLCLPRKRIPKVCLVVLPRRKDQSAVRAEGDRSQGLLVRKRMETPAVADVPDPAGPVLRGDRDEPAVGTHGYSSEWTGPALELLQKMPVNPPEARDPVRPGRRQTGTVGRERDRCGSRRLRKRTEGLEV